MAKGIIIAKEGYTVEDASEHIYVNTDTPLLKVKSIETGSLTFDGSSFTPTWEGIDPGIAPGAGPLDPWIYTVVLPHELDYTPMYFAYSDIAPNNRVFLSSYQFGLSLDGLSLATSATADNEAITLGFSTQKRDFGGNVLPPDAGVYAYFVYIFYDKLGPE